MGEVIPFPERAAPPELVTCGNCGASVHLSFAQQYHSCPLCGRRIRFREDFVDGGSDGE